ncbi:hypothetical protein KSF_068340 [Reticulibacter mediterranei]|uniref:Uncharacterized protein n=1 Tax=Reticulibacter mediterranei TaxID=2778369 RepID=A0A8J3IWW5_9CHLR|nr:hypothetical protein KSF_068340 [Reticulibacter mediterranei]
MQIEKHRFMSPEKIIQENKREDRDNLSPRSSHYVFYLCMPGYFNLSQQDDTNYSRSLEL